MVFFIALLFVVVYWQESTLLYPAVTQRCLNPQNFELKQLKKGGTWTLTVNTKEINWYPLQKVDFARRKLEGANPAIITRYRI